MISIITSAFKAQNTISKCIESVLKQSYKDWEMIIVVDASPDNTYNIALDFSKKDSRIKVINNTENLGAGMSRRIGIKNISHGSEYTTFLDSDDWYKHDNLEMLYKAAKETDADIVHPGHIVVEGDYKKELIPNYKLCEGLDRLKQDSSKTNHFLNTFLIKSTLWDKIEYSSRRYVEDTPTLLQLVYYSKSVLHLDYAGYYYYQNPNSLIHTASEIKNIIYLLLHCVDSYKFGDKVKDSMIKKASITKFLELINSLKSHVDKNAEEINDYKEELFEIFIFLIKILK